MGDVLWQFYFMFFVVCAFRICEYFQIFSLTNLGSPKGVGIWIFYLDGNFGFLCVKVVFKFHEVPIKCLVPLVVGGL